MLMDKKTLNRSDHIKILIKTIPLGIMCSLSWMMIVKWFYEIEFVYIQIRTVDILLQVVILLFISILPTIVGNLLYVCGVIELIRNRTMWEVFFSRSFLSLTIITTLLFFPI